MMNQCTAIVNMNTMNAKGQSGQTHSNKRGMGPKMSTQFSKTEMCKFNLLGVCNKGVQCGFAHTTNELKSRPDLSRTKFCRVFLETGQCPNYETCTFAHSRDELRVTDFHKTKFCKFWQLGQCNLGDKCRFAHSADELKEDAKVPEKLHQQGQRHNNSMPISQIQSLSQQRQRVQQQQMQPQTWSMAWREHQQLSLKETYSGCATPEYSDFDTPPMPCGSDSYDSSTPDLYELSDGLRTPDFPPEYGEQGHVRMAPRMQRLPVLMVPVQQMSAIENDTGDAIDDYTGDVEIMQAPLADETSFTQLDGTWQADSAYQVKNTFVSVDDEHPYYPLRAIRSAAAIVAH